MTSANDPPRSWPDDRKQRFRARMTCGMSCSCTQRKSALRRARMRHIARQNLRIPAAGGSNKEESKANENVAHPTA
jgi:hypothetical protein